ncbi:hypothetical protein [Alkalihalophilus marmarensis]|uniref:hypothetical protein n=1 Tax=Alkalihalophilus marmarensis TaxID=521377 RepID=UPI002E21D20E|nr:hypothetical protein [Alkalihalophilus marmarensis]
MKRLYDKYVLQMWQLTKRDVKECKELAEQTSSKTGKMYFRGLKMQSMMFLLVYFFPLVWLMFAWIVGFPLLILEEGFVMALVLLSISTIMMLLFVTIVRAGRIHLYSKVKQNVIDKYID